MGTSRAGDWLMALQRSLSFQSAADWKLEIGQAKACARQAVSLRTVFAEHTLEGVNQRGRSYGWIAVSVTASARAFTTCWRSAWPLAVPRIVTLPAATLKMYATPSVAVAVAVGLGAPPAL